MSLINAKKLAFRLNTDSELRENFLRDPKAALAGKDYGCTPEELREALVFSHELDESELEAVNGGYSLLDRISGRSGAAFREFGRCSGNFFVEECCATVDGESWCWSNDWCMIWDVEYTVAK